MPRAIRLEQITIPAPCPADWSAMAGDDRTRFCESCQKHVFDLSARTRVDAEATLAGDHPDGLCVQLRFDRRGRVITQDRRPWWTALSVAAAFVLSLVGCSREDADRGLRGTPLPISRTAGMMSVRSLGEIQPATQPVMRTIRGDVDHE